MDVGISWCQPFDFWRLGEFCTCRHDIKLRKDSVYFKTSSSHNFL